MLRLPAFAVLLVAASMPLVLEAGSPTYTTRRVTAGVSSPVFVCQAPGDNDRLFIVQQGGQIRIFNLATNTLQAGNFLSMTGISTGGEQGLLGLAFHPNYASTSPYLYVYFTNGAGNLQVNRYTRQTADLADNASAQTVIIIPHPTNGNHNGGWIGFNPVATGAARSYLHLAVGDGGSGNDPPNNAQNINQLLGKMVRINIDADDFPADANRNYGIPAGNPFAGATAGADEIWSMGLRNPFRSSFDRQTGDIWIGDVGQNALEEIDFEPFNTPGRNYGWRKYEGTNLNFAGDAEILNHTPPVHQYARSFGVAVIGGYRYRGLSMPGLAGTYFFADNSSSRIWSSTYSGTGNLQNVTEIQATIAPGGGLSIGSISSFGEDHRGEIYICDLGGEVFQIIPTLNITNTSPLGATTVGASYNLTFAAASGSTPYSFALDSGSLPAGLTLNTSGALTGTPTAAGTSNFTLRVTDSIGTNVTKAFALTVNVAPSITTASLPDGNAGTAYSQTLAATGGTGAYTWSLASGALPTSLSLSNAGLISGTPTVGGTFNFTVRVTDSANVATTRALSITIGTSLNITTTTLPAWTATRPYNQAVAATGGTTPYVWSLSAGTLPVGLTQNTSTGAISGTPTAAGTSNFTVRVTDANTLQDTQALSIVINAVPAISTATLPNGNVGAAYNQTLTRTGGTAPFTWSVSVGTLPASLSLNAGTGAITGTPSATGTSNFTIQIADAAGATATRALAITITNAPQITSTAVTSGNIGVAYSYDVNASGSPAPTYSLTTAPAGMTINTTSGVISWTPTAAGPANVTVQAANGTLPNATQSFTINVLDYGLATRPTAAANLGLNTAALPATLSATNVFTNLTTLASNSALIPYTVNSPLWSDASSKSRWIAVPNDGAPYTAAETIGFAPAGEWTFPGGTVLVKHFELNTDERDPLIRKRLETRLLFVNNDSTVFGVTYKWRSDNTNADLLPDGQDEDITITTATGGTRVQRWHYPSRAECLQCHTQNSGGVLGVKTRQQNGTLLYPSTGVTDNQLRTWNHIGMFNTALNEATIPTYAKLSPLGDNVASLEQRVRSYIDSNCAQCHRPNGAPATFDARYDTPLSLQNIVYGAVANELGSPGSKVVLPQDVARSILHRRSNSNDPLTRMPPLARNVIDAQAISVIEQWIGSLSTSGLNGVYYDNMDFTGASVTRVDPQIDFDWTTGSPIAGIGPDTFSVRWTGQIQIPTTGTYTFFTTTDDGVRLWVNGQLLVDQWVNQGPTEYSGTIALTAGQKYNLQMDYFENAGGAVARLQWSGPGINKAVIPANVLSPVGSPAAPSSLIATASSSSQIDLTWLDAASDESGYEIERSPDGITWALLTTALANSTGYSDTGLTAATTYHYRVRAVNFVAASAYAGPASSTTMSGGGGGTPQGVKVNFQLAGAAVPSGYLADTGAIFGDRGNGFSYGWNAENSSTARDRNSPGSPDQRYDTLEHLQKPENPNAVWEIALANGTYTVRVVSGDPSYFDSVYRTSVEGVQALSATPTSTQRWFEGTATVTLTDGRLTIANAAGAQNNKICFVDITPQTTAPLSRDLGDGLADTWTFETSEATQISMAMLYTKASSDALRLKAKLPGIPTDTVLTGQTVGVDVGGATLSFTLDKKGRGRSKQGSIRAKFDKSGMLWVQLSVRKGQWKDAWADGGLNKSTPKTSVEIPFVIVVGERRFGGSKTLQYAGRKEKTGKAK